ncbi:MAG: phosphoribosylformylglycinamidine synthase [Acidobacteriota bacterium]
MPEVKRIFVEKKKGFDTESVNLLRDIKENLDIGRLEGLRIISRYDVSGLAGKDFSSAVTQVFSEPPVDIVHFEKIKIRKEEWALGVEYLPGQYDQRADSASQAIQIITLKERPLVLSAAIYIFKGGLTAGDQKKIRQYLINPVDSREASLEKPDSLSRPSEEPENVRTLKGFRDMSDDELESLIKDQGLAMSPDDLIFTRHYFKTDEKRDPTITELKILDTYWSDHCRHTTFETKIDEVTIESGHFNEPVRQSYEDLQNSFSNVYEAGEKDLTLMSIATLSMKELRAEGLLDDMEISGEINACSIERDVMVDGKKEKWLIMFKNETHNHPTEIEPFGGAATCLGGAIRDPLSGRSYVYQAMRVTGSGDPRKSVSDTIPGKLPQRKITTEAARGYSSYGNQIGLATGKVHEIYHEGYLAKRMEVGAVIGAVPKKNVLREEPEKGDLILLIGGKTGRDGIGGATGSSKEHDERSIVTAGAEVQKGNPPEERKLQRLFRNPGFTKLVKKSNDFGAGGVSVAIGELAPGLNINLDKVPKKYEGLDGTEIALSESQERMAVVVDPVNVKKALKFAEEENLIAVKIADVTDDNRLRMYWRGDLIVDIGREFLDSNGVRQFTGVEVKAPVKEENYFKNYNKRSGEGSVKEMWTEMLKDINFGSQRGLTERFDSSIGAGTILMPLGGKSESTDIEAMSAKVPVLNGDTSTATLMSFGFNPRISSWSPYHGAYYSVVEAVSRIVAAGGDPSRIRTSLQEYFEKLGKDPEKWGKPFSALTGAYTAHRHFGIAAIGGKDSMSGSFMEMNVPPTLITFAVETAEMDNVISPEFKVTGNRVYQLMCGRDEFEMPDHTSLIKGYKFINEQIIKGNIISAASIGEGGMAHALTRMCSGNLKGFRFENEKNLKNIFSPDYGSIIFEVTPGYDAEIQDCTLLGEITDDGFIETGNEKISVDELVEISDSVLEKVFPTKGSLKKENPETELYKVRGAVKAGSKFGKPRVVIPVFPGTNCEYDTAGAFQRAGGVVETIVFNNLSAEMIKESIGKLAESINNSQIISIPGGFSAGDEPEGSGKFIAAVFRNPLISEAVAGLIQKRDGLILGICNGFQALIKLGLLPYGEISDLNEDSPTLTFNSLGRHVSTMVNTRVTSVLSPWFLNLEAGDIHTIPVSHGEGRFSASEELVRGLEKSGQIATQYIDPHGNPTYDIKYNPNGSDFAIEGITSPDGRIMGKMGHSERVTNGTFKNIPGNKEQKIFGSGIKYFK